MHYATEGGSKMASEATKELGRALCAKLGSDDWCTGKGGGFWVKGHGFFTAAKARKLTGIAAEKRVVRPIATTGMAGGWNMVVGIVNMVSRSAK
jgi:hypothetical protein